MPSINVKKSDLKNPKKIAKIRRVVLKAVGEKEQASIGVKAKVTTIKKPKKTAIKKTNLEIIAPEKDVVLKDVNLPEAVLPAEMVEQKTVVPIVAASDKEVSTDIAHQETPVSPVKEIKTIGHEQAKQIIDQHQQSKSALPIISRQTLIAQADKIKIVPSKKKGVWIFSILSVITLLLLLAVLFFIPKSDGPIVVSLSKVVPFPALVVGDRFITYADYLQEVNSVTSYLERQKKRGIILELPSHEKIKDDVKKYFIRQEMINLLAKQNNIQISQEEIDAEIGNIEEQSRSAETFDEVLKDVYGWNRQEFIQKVIQPYLLSKKVAKALFSELDGDDLQKAWETKIAQLQHQVRIYNFVK